MELARLASSLGDSPKSANAPETPAISPDKAAQAFEDLKKVGPEIESERELNAKVYAKADGTRVAKIYADPIHFKDSTGKLRDIDNTIVSDATGFRNSAGPNEVKFARRADAGEVLNVKKQSKEQVSFSLQGAAGSTGITDGSAITYPEVRPGVDLKYVMSTKGVKELLVIKQRPATDQDVVFRFNLDTKGLEPRMTSQGGIEILDTKGTVHFTIPPAMAWDSAPIAASVPGPGAAKLALIREGNLWFLELTAFGEWLSAAEREFPAFVDPTVETVYLGQLFGTIGDDAYVSNAWPADQQGQSVYWGNCCWTNLSGRFVNALYETYTKYDVTPFNNKKINLAHWWSFGADASLNPNPARIKAVDHGGYWASGNITWNTKPAHRPGQKLGQVVKDQWGVFDVTDWVARWTSQGWQNNGFMLDVNDSGTLILTGGQEDFNRGAFLVFEYQNNNPPTQPIPEEPANASTISTLTPQLKVTPSTDLDNDPIQYGWAVLDAQGNVVHIVDYAVGQTSITVPAGKLQYGQTYKWWSSTFDGYTYTNPTPENMWTFTPVDPGVASSTPTGLEDYFPYQDFPLGQGTAFANMANGNLTVQDTDLDIPGQGLNMRLLRTYNSNDDAVDDELGKGWRLGISDGSAGASGSGALDLMQIVNVLFGGNAFDLTDVDGTRHHFVRDAGGTWISPPGVNLKVSTPLLGGYYDITRPDGVVYRFDAIGGGSHRLSSIKDRKGNFLNFGYDSFNKPLTITDTVNRTITFDYLNGPNVRFATFTGGGSTLVTEYQYEGGRLKRVIRQPDSLASPTAVYNYNTQGLSQVTDRRGNTTNFTIAPGTTRLTQVADRAAQPWKLRYTGEAITGATCVPNGLATASVCLEDPELKVTVWSTNPRGNLLSRRDAGDKNVAGADRFNTENYTWGIAGNDDNRLTSQTDQAGNATSYSYNPLGQISGSTATGAGDPASASIFDFNYPVPGVGEITRARTAANTSEERIWDFTYDPFKGTLLTSEDPLDNKTVMTYYDRGLLKTVKDANLNTTTYGDTAIAADGGYDATGQPRKITDAIGKVTSFTYDFLGFQETRVDRRGMTWNTDYDLRGNLLSSATPAPLSDTTTFCYDGNDNQTAVMPPRFTGTRSCTPGPDGTDGFSTKISYDARDLVSSTITKSDGKYRRSSYSYFADGQLKEILEPRSFSITNPTGSSGITQKASYQRFANNRISAFVDEEGNQTEVIHTAHGLPEVITDPPGQAGRHTMTYTYNRLRQVKTLKESGIAPVATNEYNMHGDMTRQTNRRGKVTEFTPDKIGRVLTVKDANDKITIREYDSVGNLKFLEQPTDTGVLPTRTSYGYTARNEIDYESDPADSQHFIDYDYDDEGRQEYRYDRRSTAAAPTGGTIERTHRQVFRADGRTTESKASGTSLSEHRTVFNYDADGNTTLVDTYKDGSASVNVSGIVATYTSAGELDTWSEKIFPPSGAAVTRLGSYDWGQDGLQDSNTVDGQNSASTWFKDGNEKTFTPYSNWGSFNSTYYANGALNQMIYPIYPGRTESTKLTQQYDSADRTTSRVFTNTAGTKISAWEAITYDENRNRKTENVTQLWPVGTGSVPPGTGSYLYDNLDRLTSFKHPFEPATSLYGLDDAGNVKSETGATPATFNFTNNRLNRRTINTTNFFDYSYDNFGNQVSETETNLVPKTPITTTYNAASHTKRVTAANGTWVEYNYDGLGRMVSRQTNAGVVTLFFHQGLSEQLALETDAVASVSTRYIVDAYDMPRGKLDIGNSTGRVYYITDPRGNVTQMVGYIDHTIKAVFAYDPYGKDKTNLSKKLVSSNWDSRLKFQMAPQDSTTKNYSLSTRLMDPKINRFVGTDNYVSAGANLGLQLDPLTGNRYLYAGANPVGLIDDGHAPNLYERFQKPISQYAGAYGIDQFCWLLLSNGKVEGGRHLAYTFSERALRSSG